MDYRQYKLSAKPDRQDRRDKYKADTYSASTPLPTSYTLPYLPPIKDQGQTESCTGHSIAYFSEVLVGTRSNQFVDLAPFFTWYYARLEEGSQTQDTGVQMRSIMDALHTYGICPTNFWPMGSPIATEPNNDAKVNAVFKLPVYERCATIQDIKYALAAENYPVCVGVEVFNSWYDSSVNGSGIIQYIAGQQSLGGHAICCVGYDDNAQLLMFANSWSTNYGKNGFIYIPYNYLENTWFDAWTAGKETVPQI